MSEVKFTPGPWKVGFNDGSGFSGGRNETTFVTQPEVHKELGLQCVIAECRRSFIGPADVPATANAHLIAAAPELYDALDEIVSDRVWCDEAPFLAKAKSVLAKARGENHD